MRTGHRSAGWVLGFALLGAAGGLQAGPDPLAAHARKLHFDSIVVDTHADTTQRLMRPGYDFMRRNSDGSQVDLPRMREGGLDAQFMSIWIDSSIQGPKAVQLALDQIDAVRQLAANHPAELVLARTAAEVRAAHARHQVALLLGVEGGHMLGNDLRMVRVLADLGVRYITLAHFHNSEWADSSTDKPAHDGLAELGRGMVREMNRQGVLIDISHVSDKTFQDVLAVSRAPVIASHSSVRALSAHPRNMSDEMIRALAQHGGVIQINYEESYLDEGFRKAFDTELGGTTGFFDALSRQCAGDDACITDATDRRIHELQAQGKLPHVSWEKIVEHIDHVVRLVGPEHVGLGSDFDGATMPDGLADCSQLPRITEALVRRGYSDADIGHILGGNVLRVLEEARQVGVRLRAAPVGQERS